MKDINNIEIFDGVNQDKTPNSTQTHKIRVPASISFPHHCLHPNHKPMFATPFDFYIIGTYKGRRSPKLKFQVKDDRDAFYKILKAKHGKDISIHRGKDKS